VRAGSNFAACSLVRRPERASHTFAACKNPETGWRRNDVGHWLAGGQWQPSKWTLGRPSRACLGCGQAWRLNLRVAGRARGDELPARGAINLDPKLIPTFTTIDISRHLDRAHSFQAPLAAPWANLMAMRVVDLLAFNGFISKPDRRP